VDVIFGVVGGNSLFLTDAIVCHGKMRFVPMHGEKDAGYAAIGYSKQRGGLGVACVTTGCASTNIVTAVLSAWQDSVPLIVLAGQVPTNRLGTEGRQSGTQGADMEPIVRSITKGVEEWDAPSSCVPLMDLALTPRRGPVWISVPLNLQSSLSEREFGTAMQ
jgi:acetolactate synthase-1/2/3 large subunit